MMTVVVNGEAYCTSRCCTLTDDDAIPKPLRGGGRRMQNPLDAMKQQQSASVTERERALPPMQMKKKKKRKMTQSDLL